MSKARQFLATMALTGILSGAANTSVEFNKYSQQSNLLIPQLQVGKVAEAQSKYKKIYDGAKWVVRLITENEVYNTTRYCVTDSQECKNSIKQATKEVRESYNEVKSTVENTWWSPKSMSSWVCWAYKCY
jgi:hypothetical protein